MIREAERQLNLVFRDVFKVPLDLITVEMRWGDKKKEMKLLPAHVLGKNDLARKAAEDDRVA